LGRSVADPCALGTLRSAPSNVGGADTDAHPLRIFNMARVRSAPGGHQVRCRDGWLVSPVLHEQGVNLSEPHLADRTLTLSDRWIRCHRNDLPGRGTA